MSPRARMRTASLLALSALASALAGCQVDDVFDPSLTDPPPDPGGPPGPPSGPPATGSKWQGLLVDGACGRQKLAWVMVDEVCGGTDDPAYMDYFRAPIVRDGAALAGRLYAVDASYLWVLDASDPAAPARKALLSGFGEPLALATHAGRLLIAAGDEGLIVADVADPDHPARAGTVALPGPALDVDVHGDRAYVALGHGGVGVVDLTNVALEKVLDVPGFAAAVKAKDGPQGDVAVVAACDTVAILDVGTSALLGQTWVDQPYDGNNLLIAPAKDVELIGDTAFVAAGRFGAVAIDLADPSAPAVRGNCTQPDDLAFYASGVRASADGLFVAGGEFGVLPLDVSSPATTCSATVVPALPPPPADETVCTTEPPWEILPWSETWSPPPVPPEGRDPLQTLPLPGRLYAFGDATRIGIRAIDVRDPLDLGVKLGRYSEPRLTEGIAAKDGKVIVAGRAGGLFDASTGTLLKIADVPEAAQSRAAAFLDDGRWVLGGADAEGGGRVVFEGSVAPFTSTLPIWAGGLVAHGDRVVVGISNGVLALDDTGPREVFDAGRFVRLPPGLVAGDEYVIVAAPEWPDALRLDGFGPSPLEAALRGDDLADVGAWRAGLPRRTLLERADGTVIELASLGGKATLTVHAAEAAIIDLPGGDYLGAALAEDTLVALAVDRGRYRSQLVAVDLDAGAVLGSVGFTGSASGLAADGPTVYVADGDRGVRVFDLSSGEPVQTQLLELAAP